MPKNVQTTTHLHSSHMLVKQCPKISKPGFNSTWTVNFQMFKLNLEKAEGVGDGQGGLACCNSWGHKELDTTQWLNWTELAVINYQCPHENLCSISSINSMSKRKVGPTIFATLLAWVKDLFYFTSLDLTRQHAKILTTPMWFAQQIFGN